MVVIGGAGTRYGALLGGVLYTLADQRLGSLAGSSTIDDLPSVLSTPLSEPLFVLGVLFILVVFFVPGGIVGLGEAGSLGRRLEGSAALGPPAGPNEERARCTPNGDVRIAYERHGRRASVAADPGARLRPLGLAARRRAARAHVRHDPVRQPRRRRERHAAGPVHRRGDGSRRGAGSRRGRRRARTSSGRASAAWSRRSSRSAIPSGWTGSCSPARLPGGTSRRSRCPQRTVDLMQARATSGSSSRTRSSRTRAWSSSTGSSRTASAPRRDSRPGRRRPDRGDLRRVRRLGVDRRADARAARRTATSSSTRATPSCSPRRSPARELRLRRLRPSVHVAGAGAVRARARGVPCCRDRTAHHRPLDPRPCPHDARPRRDRPRRPPRHLPRARRGLRRVGGGVLRDAACAAATASRR